LAANYVGGTVASFPILEDGSLGESTSVHAHKIEKVNLPRQEAAHAHMIVSGMEENAVFAVDLGTDKVIKYYLDENGVMEKRTEIQVSEGAGPRHLAFHSTQNIMYVLGELNYSIEAFKYEAEKDKFERIQTVNTWDIGEGDGMVNCAAIKVHPSGKFLYASNRDIKSDTQNGIAMFRIDPDSGKLTHLGTQDSKGLIPRDFEIDPSGKFLLVANQNSDSIVTFEIDTDSGLLKETGFIKEVMTPVCLKFLP
jgi:6-phosphogluconolactonase